MFVFFFVEFNCLSKIEIPNPDGLKRIDLKAYSLILTTSFGESKDREKKKK